MLQYNLDMALYVAPLHETCVIFTAGFVTCIRKSSSGCARPSRILPAENQVASLKDKLAAAIGEGNQRLEDAQHEFSVATALQGHRARSRFEM